jgi:hypothetical protein
MVTISISYDTGWIVTSTESNGSTRQGNVSFFLFVFIFFLYFFFYFAINYFAVLTAKIAAVIYYAVT